MINKKTITDAYCRIREIDHTIPDDVLDFMKNSAIEKFELNQKLEEFHKQNVKCPNLDLNNYIVLNPINELSHIEKNQLAVGVKNFGLAGREALQEFKFKGKKYKRLHTDVIPTSLSDKLCSVQIYEEII